MTDAQALLMGSLALLLAALAALAVLRFRLIGVIAVGVALSLVCSSAYACAQLSLVLPEGSVSAVVVLSEDAVEGSFSPTARARVYCAQGDAVTAKVRLRGEAARFRSGDAFRADVSLSYPKDADLQRYWEDGIQANAIMENVQPFSRGGLLSLLTRMRNAAIDAMGSSSLDSEAHAVLAALTCGYRSELREQPIYGQFKAAGLAHVVAVSGAHLSIVTALLGGLLVALRCPRWLVIVLQGMFVALFLMFAAAPISAIRAAIMAWASLLSYIPHRRPASLNAIGLCIMVILAVAPSSCCSASFALSAGSTLGIVLFASLVQAWFSRGRMPRFVAESLSITLSASLLTIPYSAALFSQLSLVSPLANILVTPLFSIACGLGLACVLLSVAVPACAPAVLSLGSVGVKLLCIVVGAVSSIPYACIPFAGSPFLGVVLSVCLATLLWRAWPQLVWKYALGGVAAATSVAMCFALLWSYAQGPSLVMLDVGQGDAFLIRDGARAVLIDTGTNDGLLRQALARNMITHLDAVIITHGDDDHDGSLPALAQSVKVDAVFVARDALSCSCKNCTELRRMAGDAVGKEGLQGLSKGDVVECGRMSLRVMAPMAFVDEGGNADSLVVLVGVDVDADGAEDATCLMVGDAENDQLQSLIDRRELGNVDLYKVGHHGSKAAITDSVAKVLHPVISLVSVGEGNRYGHPADGTISCLESVGSKIFRTDQQGDVTCLFKDGSIEVRTQR